MPEQIERPVEPSEEKVFCGCDNCGGDIYAGEEYYDFFGDIVCENCLRDYLKENFRRVADGI